MCKMSHVSKMHRKARYEHGNSMETGGYKSRGTSRLVENWAEYRVCNPHIILDKPSYVHFHLPYAATELPELLDIYPTKIDSPQSGQSNQIIFIGLRSSKDYYKRPGGGVGIWEGS